MDRSWINTPRISDAYEKEVEEFLQFAQHNVVSNHNGVRIRCPCVNCLNGRILNVYEVREHLLCDGFLKNYTTWTWYDELLDFVKYKNRRQSKKWVLIEHNKTFMSWFKQQIMNDPSASETLTWIANDLKFDVLCCSGYEVNGCLFYTKSRDDRSTMQNSRVTLEAESMQFSTAKDQNPVVGSMPYYDFIVEI